MMRPYQRYDSAAYGCPNAKCTKIIINETNKNHRNSQTKTKTNEYKIIQNAMYKALKI